MPVVIKVVFKNIAFTTLATDERTNARTEVCLVFWSNMSLSEIMAHLSCCSDGGLPRSVAVRSSILAHDYHGCSARLPRAY